MIHSYWVTPSYGPFSCLLVKFGYFHHSLSKGGRCDTMSRYFQHGYSLAKFWCQFIRIRAHRYFSAQSPFYSLFYSSFPLHLIVMDTKGLRHIKGLNIYLPENGQKYKLNDRAAMKISKELICFSKCTTWPSL